MNWDQIEHKWAAMTRRVRTDWTVERPDALAEPPRVIIRSDGKVSALVDHKVKFDDSRRQKTLSE